MKEKKSDSCMLETEHSDQSFISVAQLGVVFSMKKLNEQVGVGRKSAELLYSTKQEEGAVLSEQMKLKLSH